MKLFGPGLFFAAHFLSITLISTDVLQLSVRFFKFAVLFKSSVSLLTFFLVLSNNEKEVLKSPTSVYLVEKV